MAEDFFINPQDLSEIHKKSREITREVNRKKIDDLFTPKMRSFLENLGNSLGNLGVVWDFDVAQNRVILILPISNIPPDSMPFEVIEAFCEGNNNVNPEGFALAIKAGLISPQFFRFWGGEDLYED